MIVSKVPWQPHAVVDHYDELCSFYRTLWGEHLHHGLRRSGTETDAQVTEQLLEVVATYAPAAPDPRTLRIITTAG